MSKALIFFIFMQAFTAELCNRIITFNVKNLRYVSKHIFFVRVNVELEIIDRLEYIDP